MDESRSRQRDLLYATQLGIVYSAAYVLEQLLSQDGIIDFEELGLVKNMLNVWEEKLKRAMGEYDNRAGHTTPN
jgi:hypothetical protein